MIPAAVLLCGCALRHRPAVPEPARGPARDSLFQVDQRRGEAVAARGMVDGMLSVLAPNVVFLRAGVPAVYGRNGVRELLSAGVPAEGTTDNVGAVGRWRFIRPHVRVHLRCCGAKRNSALRNSARAVHRRLAATARRCVADQSRTPKSALLPRMRWRFSTNVVTPPLVALPPALRESLAQCSRGGQPVRRSVRSHGAWLRVVEHDRTGRRAVRIVAVDRRPGCGPRFLRDGRAGNVADVATGLRVGDRAREISALPSGNRWRRGVGRRARQFSVLESISPSGRSSGTELGNLSSPAATRLPPNPRSSRGDDMPRAARRHQSPRSSPFRYVRSSVNEMPPYVMR